MRKKYSEMSEEQKEKYRQYHRNYYQTHKQQHRARCDKWAKEHPDKVKEIRKKWQELHSRKFVAVVRCKDCKHRGDMHKCIVAFVAEKQEMPYFFYDNRGEWFCADGERKDEE